MDKYMAGSFSLSTDTRLFSSAVSADTVGETRTWSYAPLSLLSIKTSRSFPVPLIQFLSSTGNQMDKTSRNHSRGALRKCPQPPTGPGDQQVEQSWVCLSQEAGRFRYLSKGASGLGSGVLVVAEDYEVETTREAMEAQRLLRLLDTWESNTPICSLWYTNNSACPWLLLRLRDSLHCAVPWQHYFCPRLTNYQSCCQLSVGGP